MSHVSTLIPLEKELSRAFFGPAMEKQELTWSPTVNVYESAEAYRIELELPGVPKSGVQVRYEDEVLIVEGERKQPELSDNVKVWKDERKYGKFMRTFRLTKDIDLDSTTANMQGGILSLDIKKSEKAKARMIEICGE